ncbi:competence/damage-inducible protein A [Thiolapillus sp.]|uniref:competence/damage-inducible protein A n=1 Tax=Thiolapillus sp. TaxID=2017437 RepID=UPI003AF8D9F9
MPPIIEIFSQGEELIRGQIVDSNAAWLSEQLAGMGLPVRRHSTVGDNMDDLTSLLQEIARRADCCICTGGLGPTVDDLTAEAVAAAFNLPLEFDPVAYEQIAAWFQRRKRPMPESNRKQAMLPRGATRLDNHWGTAPGFALQQGRCWFAFVPGVPYEMRQLFREAILPELQRSYPHTPEKLVVIKTVGIGESDLQQRLEGIDFPGQVQLGFRTASDEIQTKLLFPHDYPDTGIETITLQVVQRLGEAVFFVEKPGEGKGTLVTVVGGLLRSKGKNLALVETLSHGLLASKCLGQDWLSASLVLPGLQEDHRAAERLAAMVRKQGRADYVLVQLCQDDARSLADEKSPATMDNVLFMGSEPCRCQQIQVSGTLPRKQNRAAILALDFIRRSLQQEND